MFEIPNSVKTMHHADKISEDRSDSIHESKKISTENPAKLTILSSKVRQSKKFILTEDRIETKPFSKTKYFSSDPHEFETIKELGALIEYLSKTSNSMIIHGYRDQSHSNIRRQTSNFPEPPEGVGWACLDIDGWKAPDGVEPNSMEAVEELIKCLPKEFHERSYFYQFSNSAGIRKADGKLVKDGTRVHLFYMFEKPASLASLKSYFIVFCFSTNFTIKQENSDKDAIPVIDPALLNAVQPITIALS